MRRRSENAPEETSATCCAAGPRAPVAYLVGRKEFYSLTLEVSPAVLIPRPDSEFAVVESLAMAKSLERPRAVDVGTGSGCLAIACTHQHPTIRFVAIDCSAEALAVARSNAGRHGVADRIDFRLGDLLEPVASESPFDLIVSNPPYIPTDVIPTLEPGVRDHGRTWPLTADPTVSAWSPGSSSNHSPCSIVADT